MCQIHHASSPSGGTLTHLWFIMPCTSHSSDWYSFPTFIHIILWHKIISTNSTSDLFLSVSHYKLVTKHTTDNFFFGLKVYILFLAIKRVSQPCACHRESIYQVLRSEQYHTDTCTASEKDILWGRKWTGRKQKDRQSKPRSSYLIQKGRLRSPCLIGTFKASTFQDWH